jgi:hypothetical protein
MLHGHVKNNGAANAFGTQAPRYAQPQRAIKSNITFGCKPRASIPSRSFWLAVHCEFGCRSIQATLAFEDCTDMPPPKISPSAVADNPEPSFRWLN